LFTLIAGIILMLSSISAGVVAVDVSLIEPETEFINIISNKVVMGQFFAGVLPILWIGIGAIFAGTFLSNWLGGVSRQITDTLRLVVLLSLYPTVSQFTNVLINDESSFTLILPLLAGLAATIVAATILFKKYRKRSVQEMQQDSGSD
jgi:putative membrane protein